MLHPTQEILVQTERQRKQYFCGTTGDTGSREAESARGGESMQLTKSDWSRRLRILSMARSSARQGAQAEALRRGCWPQHAGGDEKNSGQKVSGATRALGLKARARFWIMKSVHRAHGELYSLVLRRSQSAAIFVGSTA